MEFDLELDRVEQEIKKSKAGRVLIQLPDGLKPKATEIAKHLESRAPGTTVFIWAGSNFGGCDTPLVRDIDLLVNFGHAPFKK